MHQFIFCKKIRVILLSIESSQKGHYHVHSYMYHTGLFNFRAHLSEQQQLTCQTHYYKEQLYWHYAIAASASMLQTGADGTLSIQK